MKNFIKRVKCGEKINDIARQFNLPVQDLILANNLTEEIEDGDLLIIPTVGDRLYDIMPCESYASISKKLGVLEQDLRQKNSYFPYLFYGVKIKY